MSGALTWSWVVTTPGARPGASLGAGPGAFAVVTPEVVAAFSWRPICKAILVFLISNWFAFLRWAIGRQILLPRLWQHQILWYWCLETQKWIAYLSVMCSIWEDFQASGFPKSCALKRLPLKMMYFNLLENPCGFHLDLVLQGSDFEKQLIHDHAAERTQRG